MKIKTDLHNLPITVCRPITIQVINDIQTYLGLTTGIDSTLTEDIFNSDERGEIDISRNTTIGNVNTFNGSRDKKFIVDYKDDVIEDQLGLSDNRLVTYPNIFNDTLCGVTISPMYYKHRMTFTLKYMDKNLTNITSLIKRLKSNVVNDRNQYLHNLHYYYIIPPIVNRLTNNILKIRQKADLNINESLNKYLKNMYVENVTTMESPDKKASKRSVAIKEKQVNVLGRFPENYINIKPQKETDTGYFNIELNYVLEYSKPTELILEYPLQLLNQDIDSEFRKIAKKPHYVNDTMILPDMKMIDEELNRVTDLYKISDVINIPVEDNFIPKFIPSGYTPMISVILKIDENSRRELLNIEDITEVAFSDGIKYILKNGEHSNISKVGQSLILAQLYEGSSLVSTIVCMDEKLNMYTNIDLDPKITYRVIMSGLSDEKYLSLNARNRLAGYNENNDYKETLKALSDIITSDSTDGIVINVKDYKRINNLHTIQYNKIIPKYLVRR